MMLKHEEEKQASSQHNYRVDSIPIRHISTFVYRKPKDNSDFDLFNMKHTTTPTEASHPKARVPTHWSKVFGGPCGRFIIFCFFLGLALFAAMIFYIVLYASSVLNNPNIMCTPFFLFAWISVLPTMLVIWFLAIFFSLCCVDDHKAQKARCRNCRACFCTYISISYGILYVLALGFVSISSEQWVIIKDHNNSDIMFQYLGNKFDSKVYPILSRPNNINDTFPNSTCEPVQFSSICFHIDPFRYSNLSKVFRCQPNDEDSVEFTFLYLKPLTELSQTAITLGLLSVIFFVLGYNSVMQRRLSSPDKWIGKQCCRPFNSKPNEWTRLI